MNTRAEIARRLELHLPLASRVLESFIQDAVKTAEAEGVVVGLSGGVDSALAAALAVRALGRERVLALFLPYRTSDPESRIDAQAVASTLQLELVELEISAQIDAYFDRVDPAADRVRRGNKMARERMSILFDFAKKLNRLVLGTSNKTEILLGYSTVFGDNASSLNPIGDLYKRQVCCLAEFVGIPAKVVQKAPTADLFPGQTDEGELGFDYATADEVLFLLFDQGYRPEEIIALGYSAPVVERIVELERRNRFKRRLMLVARLSGSAVNLDREIPRD
jgi:NAD+ synthase